jgi:UDP-N-acetylglucosamine 2-epimerase (non-hydrolysing)
MKILSVVGARPNFMKIAPFIRAVKAYNVEHGNVIQHLLVHTGQHYDVRMSKAFFSELEIPEPDINLEIGSGSHAEQLGYTMIAFEKVLLTEKPDWVVVVGDVNATLSCSVAAKRLNIKVCHIEAGLRSGDMTMPEEINRLVTDRISDLLLTPDEMSSRNLLIEGTHPAKIRFTGNIMIDTLDHCMPKAERLSPQDILQSNVHGNISVPDLFSSEPAIPDYALLTLHRPSNVDTPGTLEAITGFLVSTVAARMPLIWPVHPRTRKQLESFGLMERLSSNNNIILLEPIGYLEMLRLNMSARVMITDSGGLQEECCVLGTPCITLRSNTERPVTLMEHGGVSLLAGNEPAAMEEAWTVALGMGRKAVRPELWDGGCAVRCVEELMKSLKEKV